MNNTLTSLSEEFPDLYKGFQGFQCRDGWYDILFDLSVDLCWLTLEDISFRAVQVKEKFGGLRFYVTHETKEVTEAIREAEDRCGETCEWCGKPGQPTKDHRWFLTLCETHKNELGRT